MEVVARWLGPVITNCLIVYKMLIFFVRSKIRIIGLLLAQQCARAVLSALVHSSPASATKQSISTVRIQRI